MRKKNRVELRSWVLLLMIFALSFIFIWSIKQLEDADTIIRKSQVNQNINTGELETRVHLLEEVVVLQNELIVQLNEQQPSPEISQTVTDQKEVKEKVEKEIDSPSFWPAAVVGTLEFLRVIVNPVSILSPH